MRGIVQKTSTIGNLRKPLEIFQNSDKCSLFPLWRKIFRSLLDFRMLPIMKLISSFSAKMYGMSSLRGIATVLIILCMIGASCIAFAADGQSAPHVADSPSGSSGRVTSLASPTTVKATIAPIETRELSVKPPAAEGTTASPTITSTPSVVPTTTRTAIPTTAPTPLPDSLNDPGSAVSFFQWGLAFASQGEYKAARGEFEKSLARDPQNTETWYHLGRCDEALGYVDQARNAFTYVLQVDPMFVPSTNVGGESALFLELQSNMTSPQIVIEPEVIQDQSFTYFLMGALLVIILLFVSTVIARQHYQKTHPPAPVIVPAPVIAPVIVAAPRQLLSSEKINEMADQTMEYFDGDRKVVVELLTIASEIAAEGREGKHVGTAFILGDTDRVLENSRQLILNPFAGHDDEVTCILTPQFHESIKELAQMDGAFVIRDDGVVVSAGRYITVDTSGVKIPGGFGTRHVSTAAITDATDAIGIVVSESGGSIRIFANGEIIASTKT